jgi:hypothetical protein
MRRPREEREAVVAGLTASFLLGAMLEVLEVLVRLFESCLRARKSCQ